MAVVLPLETTNEKLVGGKAAALGKLIRAGYNVPPGFVIPAGSQLDTAAILKAFDTLGSPLVAVRSSAMNEDGLSLSWAGQFDTYLNVGRGDLINKIQACRASANSESVVAYGKAGAMAVIVQTMIAGEVSGVAFSVHPITQRQQVVIEAVAGLGETLVSGEATPDNYVVHKARDNIAEKAIAPSTGKQKLADTQILEIAACTMDLERDFGFPVDIEWTFSGAKLYILQCRPITTLD